MALTPATALSFAEQGLAVDKARLDALTSQRNQIADVGGDTAALDAQISTLQADVDAGIQDVFDAQQAISTELAAAEGTTAETGLVGADPIEAGEDLTAEEQSALDSAGNPGDETTAAPDASQSEDQSAAETARLQSAALAAAKSKVVDITDTSKPAAKASATKASASVPAYVPRDNPLHGFATYTYSIALYILTEDDINLLTKNPALWAPGAGATKTCLIASGGKNSGAYARNKHFTDDFYFDNLKMTTIIGLNARSKASNAIDIGFTVLEPYGMTLLDRIMSAAEDIKAPNFKAMPYLLEVEFYGYDDKGNVKKVDDQRKRIPIQIIEMKIKASTKGAEYTIKAVPWSHQAFSMSAASTPVNIEVKASTVAEFFANADTDTAAIKEQYNAKANATSDKQRMESDLKAQKDATNRNTSTSDPRSLTYDAKAAGTTQSDVNTQAGIINRAFQVSSFCGGVNAWKESLIANNLRGTKDTILVVPHPSIAAAKITKPKTKDISRVATSSDKPAEVAKASANDATRVFTDASAFPVSAGTSILAVIDMVMRNSSYITDQVADIANTSPADIAEKLGKPLKWYKVIPTVEVGKYDYTINQYSTKTTYYIEPYTVYDSKHPNGPTATPNGSIKHYYYSYTGKNRDVIDFQIDFDTLFYTAVTAGASKWQADLAQAAATQRDDAQKVPAEGKKEAAALVNRRLGFVTQQVQSSGLQGQQQGTTTILAADIQKGLYGASKGDMLSLNLKIVGDPELIKQDDIYTNPSQGGYQSQITTTGVMHTGSVPMDNGEVIALVEFRTIMDMDPSTGLPKEQADARNSIFTGLYRLLEIENIFQGGRFEQTVKMVRLPDSVNSGTDAAGKGSDTTNSRGMGSELADKANLANAARLPTDLDASALTKYLPTDIPTPEIPQLAIPGLQTFDDGSTLQTFDDGSTLAVGTDGALSSSIAPSEEATQLASSVQDAIPTDLSDFFG